MRKLFAGIALSLCCGAGAMAAPMWTSVSKIQAPPVSSMQIVPSAYVVYQLDVAALKSFLWALPSDPALAGELSLPMGDGSMRSFRVWQSAIMPQTLADKYPTIKTFTGIAADDPRVTIKLDFNSFGFHAAIFDGHDVSFVDPYNNTNDGYYIAHYKAHEHRTPAQRMICKVGGDNISATTEPMQLQKATLSAPATGTTPASGDVAASFIKKEVSAGHVAEALTVNGTQIRTYRLAVSANNFYCRAATGLTTPTIAQCLSRVVTSINRVNGVYNRELSVQMNLVATQDQIIWPTATGSANGADPFDAINTNASSCISTNQTVVDTRIGNANYDVGHVFTTGAGGLAGLGVVCNSTQKARGVTGSSVPVGDAFDIDYVAHELGHQFGSSHTFNNNVDGSCNGNASSANAYEPASGATIMDYAGICSPDNVQANSQPYFSASSLIQIQARLAGSGGTCAVNTPSGHAVASVAAFTANYTIPYKTPFELLAPTATVTGADTAITYGWHQWNRGDFGARLNQTFVRGPIFRSYQPAYTPLRIFPALNTILAGALSNAGEKAPDTTRYLTFRLAVRNIFNGNGCFIIPDDTVHIDAVTTGAANGFQGFRVTSQNTTGITYVGGSTQTVTWNVVGTNLAPVSAANVDIYMSVDGAQTWPYFVGTFPNTGSATITVPNPPVASTTARFKVKGSGNVFFNINGANFTVNPGVVTAPITGTFTVCAGATTTLASATPGGTWSSSSTAVATVSASGVVTGIAAGTATITYSAPSGAVTAVVTVNATPVTPAIVGPSGICVGLTGTYTNAASGGVWSSGTPAVATISTAGLAIGVAAGTSVISYALTNACGTGYATTVVTVSAPSAVAPITGTTAICTGATTTLASTTAGGSWLSTNTAIATITSAGVVTGVSNGVALISYFVTNAAGCVSASTVNVTVGGAIATVSVAVAPNDTVCVGQSAICTAVPVNGGTSPSFAWQVNGSTVATGDTYTYTPANGDVVEVTMTATSACIGSVVVSSTPVTLTVAPPATNTISISASSSSILVGESVTFVAIAPNAGPGATYQWYINTVAVPGATNVTFVTNTLTNGQVVHCKVTSIAPCVAPAVVLSGGFTISVATSVVPLSKYLSALQVMPNPNSGSFNVSGAVGSLSDVHLIVTNLLGQQVYSNTVAARAGTINADVILPASLPSGTYMLQVNGGGSRVVYKVVVAH